MGGQMGGGSGYSADDSMAVWIESRERRIRALEAENQDLRRQLDALRQGAGITVLIDGHPLVLCASSSPTGAVSPAIPTDTRPAAAPPLHTSSRAAVQRPHVSQPGDNPYAPRVDASSPRASGFAFEQPWRGHAVPAPNQPTPHSGPSLPSMPTTQMPIPALRPAPHRPRTADSSWLTAERPAVPGTATDGRPAPAISTGLRGGEDAWLRSGAAWPQSAERPTALPPLSAAPVPPPARPERPVSAPQPASREQTPAERNVFADSFIL